MLNKFYPLAKESLYIFFNRVSFCPFSLLLQSLTMINEEKEDGTRRTTVHPSVPLLFRGHQIVNSPWPDAMPPHSSAGPRADSSW